MYKSFSIITSKLLHLCDKKIVYKVIILKRAEYQLLGVFVM